MNFVQKPLEPEQLRRLGTRWGRSRQKRPQPLTQRPTLGGHRMQETRSQTRPDTSPANHRRRHLAAAVVSEQLCLYSA